MFILSKPKRHSFSQAGQLFPEDFPFRDPDVLFNKSFFSVKEVRKMHLEDNAEEKAFVSGNTRSRPKAPASKPAAASTVASSPGQKRAPLDELSTPTSCISSRPPVYTKGRDVPLYFK